jgi:hypothetical protein
MADSKMQADIKRNADELKLLQEEMFERMERLEAGNSSRFDRLEAMQMSTESKFDAIHTALDVLIGQTPSKNNHGAGLNNRPPIQVRNVKLEFPRFDGTNVHEWIFRAEQFFDYYETPDPDHLTISSVHLDKDVVPWFQMQQRSNPFRSWLDFTRTLELDFGPSIYECPRATLFKLTQNGTVAEYYLQFTSLANRVYGLSNDALIDCFVSGLSADIRRDVLIHTPTSIVKAVSLAKIYEEKYNSTSKPQKSNPNTYPTNKPVTNKPDINYKNSTPILNTPPTRPMDQNQKNPNIRQISPAEMQLRRDKGLCYWCNDKFSFTHNCPNRQLMMLHYDDPDEDQLFAALSMPTEPPPAQIEPNQTEHHLSLNAMKGTTNMGVMRFSGAIEHIKVQILIDGGSSDNFLQPRIAKFLKLPIEVGPVFKVLVGNGDIMSAEGVIPKLPIEVQGHKLEVPVFLLPFAGADVILGAKWLATLGPHVADYAALTLNFFMNGKFVIYILYHFINHFF